MGFKERRNVVIARHNVRLEKLNTKRDLALAALQNSFEREAEQRTITCAYCRTSSPAPEWKFIWGEEYSESASRGPHSEPISGWVRKSMIQSAIACPCCKRNATIAEHKERDKIMEILEYTSVINGTQHK
ncbi:MAG TPA: hypothetical protein VJ579_03420 [Candidatus Paceibacterota bacterium]|nr:hypothetical protein [Candidatus Paceibacterota bacterium]